MAAPWMSSYDKVLTRLKAHPRTWLITGVAGFIGSHLLETLLRHDQQVVGLDNFATGSAKNLDEVRLLVSARQWARFDFVRGDIVHPKTCRKVCHGVDIVLHQAALGSVPRSIADPVATNQVNAMGILNMLVASRDAGVRRFVYASSSAVYGDDPSMPKRERRIGTPLSPYAASKLIGEILAGVFARSFGLDTIGLRYFNVFGPRQDPEGPYAAVIPQWTVALLRHRPIQINGDGRTTRDFCFIANVVQANLLAALVPRPRILNSVVNIGNGARTSLNELFQQLRAEARCHDFSISPKRPKHLPPRPGDVRHSVAGIESARKLLGYAPTHSFAEGLHSTFGWYLAKQSIVRNGVSRSEFTLARPGRRSSV